MARGDSRRTYVRDSAGRFASTPGSAAKKAAKSQSGRTSTLQARSSLKRSRAKLTAKDRADETLQGTLGRRAQKGAVTRGSKKLAGVKVAARAKLQGPSRVGVMRRPRKIASGSQMLQKAAKPARVPTATSKGVNVRGSAKPKMTATATPRAKGSRTRLPWMGGTIAKPKGLKPGALAAGVTVKPVNTLRRTGKTIKIAAKILPVKRSALDKNFERVMALKSAEPAELGGRTVFLTYKQMTRSRSKALGLDKNPIYAQSPLYRAIESIHPITLQGGYFVGRRSGVKDSYRVARLPGALLRRQVGRQRFSKGRTLLLGGKKTKPKP